MEPDALSPGSSPYYDFVYNNESDVEPTYWPLVISQMQTKRAANELYTDDPSQYITYSGSWQSLLVAREKEGRYKNFTIRAYSGDSFNFYLSIPSGEASIYYAGPLTSSGVYSVLTAYELETDAQQTSIVFQAPDDNVRVYTLPSIQAVDWVRLHHEAVASGQAYRIYQFLPRTLIQVDDLEADVIDAVTVRVSDSIVVSADDLAPGSITGEKILAGTISGVLITPGTITANEINVTQLDALASNMGTLIVNSGITLGQDGFLWTGQNVSGEYVLSKEGVRVDNSFTVAEILGTVGASPGLLIVIPFSSTAKTVAYRPSYFTEPSGSLFEPLYTLTEYSGDTRYFEILSSQFGLLNTPQSTYNGYTARITAGYNPTEVSDFRNDYTSLFIGAVSSGYAQLNLYARGEFSGSSSSASSINLNQGSITLNSDTAVELDSPVIRSLDTLAVSRKFDTLIGSLYSDILNISDAGLIYRKPQDSEFPDNSQELFRVTPSGNASVLNNLTVSGNIVGRGSSIAYLDNSDGSTIFSVSSTGLVLNSASGDRIVEISTSTGNLDLLGGDFFIYNSAESTIVAGIDKTGILQVSDGSVSAPSLSFRSDTDTGFYKAEDNVIRISTGSNLTGLFSTNQIQMSFGTDALPAFTFVNDNDTGVFRSAANSVALSAGGNQILTAASTGQVLISTTNSNGQLTIEVPNGTARTMTTWRQFNDASAYINFVCTTINSSTSPVNTGSHGSYYGRARVQVNGTVKWIPLYN